MAGEIEGSTSYQKAIAHELDENMDEEEKFSAVQRGPPRQNYRNDHRNPYIQQRGLQSNDNFRRNPGNYQNYSNNDYIRPPPTKGPPPGYSQTSSRQLSESSDRPPHFNNRGIPMSTSRADSISDSHQNQNLNLAPPSTNNSATVWRFEEVPP